jgi:hypothetical protein
MQLLLMTAVTSLYATVILKRNLKQRLTALFIIRVLISGLMVG